jgi:hypothetical protein
MLRTRQDGQGQDSGQQQAHAEAEDQAEMQPANLNLEDLDIPTFLRKRVGK